MKDTLSSVLIFAAGAAVGSVVTWRVLKTYYEKRMDEEAESIIETFTRRERENSGVIEDDTCEETQDVPAVQTTRNPGELAGQVSLLGYSNPDDAELDVEPPYVIPPDEYASRVGYDAESLTYYADGVLTDLTDEVIEDAEGVVGVDFVNHFGENEDHPDFVYVRNDNTQTDYEIERSLQRYTDVVNSGPHQPED